MTPPEVLDALVASLPPVALYGLVLALIGVALYAVFATVHRHYADDETRRIEHD